MQTEFNLIHFDSFLIEPQAFILLICFLALSNFRSSALTFILTSWYALIAQWSLMKRGQSLKTQLLLLPLIMAYWYDIIITNVVISKNDIVKVKNLKLLTWKARNLVLKFIFATYNFCLNIIFLGWPNIVLLKCYDTK